MEVGSGGRQCRWAVEVGMGVVVVFILDVYLLG